MDYLTWKALHIIGMVCWFAELFYLPRLYVYHAMAQSDGEEATMRRFCVMERKLYVMGHIGMGADAGFRRLVALGRRLGLSQGAWLAARQVVVGGGFGRLSDLLRPHQPRLCRGREPPQSCVFPFF